MARSTIDFGIDLGTTNSEIAVLNGVKAEIIRSTTNMENTPSAVWIKNERIYVGQRAKEQTEHDPDNAVAEFKRNMGNNHVYTFRDANRKMTPVELSAEVLKELRKNVTTRMQGENLEAAVITVPADFDLPQNLATQQAAKLAGFKISPLLQEPIAASLAYGFQNPSDKVFWLVYDFGGGTFDAAVIQLRDGMFQVVNHGGDKFLGGKDIDWAIVDQVFVPKILHEKRIDNFSRQNSKWRSVFAKLKTSAEKAKIELSQNETSPVNPASLFINDPYDFYYELKRSEVADIAQPFILRSIESSKKVLQDANLNPRNIEKVILVGGPTLAPYLRDMLSDPKTGLGIPLEYSVDPFTVVAQGAAIFAGSQRLDTKIYPSAAAETLAIQLEYQPVGSDPEPIVGGKVLGENNYKGYTIELANDLWSSGRLSVGANGAFMTTLQAEKGKQNVYTLRLYDPTGKPVPVSPNELKYTIGNTSSEQPITHSISIALANNEITRYFDKGTALPSRHLAKFRTSVDLHRGQNAEFLHVPIVEGESSKADRNTLVGALTIQGDSAKRDVPAGSEIEVTIAIDTSRLIRAKAYLPILDEEFEAVIDLRSVTRSSSDLSASLAREKSRINQLKEDAGEAGEDENVARLTQLQESGEMRMLEKLIKDAGTDPETARQAETRLNELQVKLDQIESDVEWPILVGKANSSLEWLSSTVEEYGNDKVRQYHASLDQDTRRAIQNRQVELLKRKTEEIRNLNLSILFNQPSWWVGYLEYLKENRADLTSQTAAARYFNEGDQAIRNQNFEGLKSAVRSLVNLLPEDKQAGYQMGYGSTLTR